jgi:SAM-dependent methyltransferase
VTATDGLKQLIGRGPEPPARSAAGPLGPLLRRLLLRVMRPYTSHQRQLDERMADMLASLETRIAELEESTVRHARLTEVVSPMNDRLAAIETQLEPLVTASRAIPYVADERYGTFEAPGTGIVYGYRELGGSELSQRSFADLFRGPEERVRERQRPYIALLAGHAPLLDVGCGRGELLDLAREEGIEARGVDIDQSMVEHCRAKGLEVELADAVEALERADDGSLGAVFSAQVIEHIPHADLVRLLQLARRKLKPAGLFVAETVNPHAGHALKAFWVDPTHQHPLFPEAVLALCQESGFPSAFVFHPCGTGDVERDRFGESEYAVIATAP